MKQGLFRIAGCDEFTGLCRRLELYARQRDGGGLAELSIRRSGTNEWKPLGSAPGAGARGSVNFSDPDCAFDIRATVGGSGPVTWAGVNLCDVKSVILNRDASAGPGSTMTND